MTTTMAGRTRTRRQAGLTALYLGIFATLWFSVPDAEPPLDAVLVVASVAALLTAVTGGIVAGRARGADAPPRDRRYLLVVVAEFAAAGLGAALLAAIGRSEFIPVLVSAVVGLHFLPLAPLLDDPLLRPLGLAVCLVALVGLVVALVPSGSVTLVVGVGTGLLLLGHALIALFQARVPRP